METFFSSHFQFLNAILLVSLRDIYQIYWQLSIFLFFQETRKDIMKSEDPFDAPTYNIPEKPVTFTEGASYSIIILAGLGVAAAAAYAVFKELIFQPKEWVSR